MKAVILAGGLGTRLSEETTVRPKPMVEIGGRPILWHILKLYSAQGINDFIICLGYKGYIIKEYFANYFLHTSDVTFDIAHNKMTVHDSVAEPWSVTLVDTGDDSGTGGRLRRVAKYLDGEDPFLMTYGEAPGAANAPAAMREQVIHARLELGEQQSLLGCDTPPERYCAPQGFNVMAAVEEPDQAERIFEALADQGSVTMPMQETFWARRFGMCTDRFGIPWMVNCAKPLEAVAGAARRSAA